MALEDCCFGARRQYCQQSINVGLKQNLSIQLVPRGAVQFVIHCAAFCRHQHGMSRCRTAGGCSPRRWARLQTPCPILNTSGVNFLGHGTLPPAFEARASLWTLFCFTHGLGRILRPCPASWYGLRARPLKASAAPSVTGSLSLLMRLLANHWMK